MKNIHFFILLFLLSAKGVSQTNKSDIHHVRAIIQGSEATMLINVIDLVGVWNSISSTPAILNAPTKPATVEILNGNLIFIKDGWQEDYPNKLRNSTWKIVDKELEIYAPETGSIPVKLEVLKGSNRFDLTINNFTYRKTLVLSSEPIIE